MSDTFEEAIRSLAKRAKTLGTTLQTEEATKNALIMPFVQALGFDVFDPRVVIPEFTADHGIKKGEKVDYAIKSGDEIIILIECKTFGANLAITGASQLFRYFSVTTARISILTNGTKFMFFSDLDIPNKMDNRPFFVFDLFDMNEGSIVELRKFRSESFTLDSILSTANDLKYLSLLKIELSKELDAPSSEITELFSRRVYMGRLTTGVKDWLGGLFSQAIKETLRDRVNQRISAALNNNGEVVSLPVPESEPESAQADATEVVTTKDEEDAFRIIQAIVRSKIAAKRIFMRDAKSYCAILVDDNNRKSIARLYMDGKKKRIGIFKSKQETRHDIEDIQDIFMFADELCEAVSEFM